MTPLRRALLIRLMLVLLGGIGLALWWWHQAPGVEELTTSTLGDPEPVVPSQGGTSGLPAERPPD
ncbi:MAG: hypothetical protein R3F15_09680 [Lysobacterales bacterium]